MRAIRERRRPDEVGKHDSDDFARLRYVGNANGLGDQRGDAGATELRRGRHVAAAGAASTSHGGAAFLAEADPVAILAPARRALHVRRRTLSAWEPNP